MIFAAQSRRAGGTLATATPRFGDTASRNSQAKAGDLTGALNDANWGLRVGPYSNEATLQKRLDLDADERRAA